MRAAFWVGCAALLLSACSSEPVQQATAAHVAPGLKASMSSSGEANCAMIGGSLSVALNWMVRRLGCVHYPTANAVVNSHLPPGAVAAINSLNPPAYKLMSVSRSPALTGSRSDPLVHLLSAFR